MGTIKIMPVKFHCIWPSGIGDLIELIVDDRLTTEKSILKTTPDLGSGELMNESTIIINIITG